MSDNVSKSKLTVGILAQMDIASNILNAINVTEDINRTNKIMKEIDTEANFTLSAAQALTKFGLQSGYTIVKQAISELPSLTLMQLRAQQNQLMQATAGYHMTASMMATQNKIMAQNNLMDLKASIVFDMPETYVRERVNKFYKSLFRPTDLSINATITQYNRGNIGETDYKTLIAELGIPDADLKYYKDEIENYPPINTFIRYASMLPFTDDSVRWLCKVNNITQPQVVTMYVNLLHAVRLRDEYSTYVQYLRNAYQDGLVADDDFLAEAEAHYISAEEAEASLANMALERARTLTKSEIATQINLYRKGVLATEAAIDQETQTPDVELFFYERLTALGLEATIANATVRLEASKLGIDWERE